MNLKLPDGVYPESVHEIAGGLLYLADAGNDDALYFAGTDCPFEGAVQEMDSLFRVPKTYETARVLWKLLPWTAPRQVLAEERTFGTGDRLGIATVGHIRAVSGYDVFPVLAQQSMRELSLMGNTYRDVLARVTFQVLQTGFRRGYGADGDHLKKAEDIVMAIDAGVTMITLDCSEHIHCQRTTAPVSPELEARYLSGPIRVGDVLITFTPETLALAQAVFGEAITFASRIYHSYIAGKPVDLEISMDETDLSTTPEQHYFVANELRLAGVPFCSLAPRFYGEFQKGVDYIGDLEQFDKEILVHAAVARHLNYKLSIHSGSDKFTVFPAIGKATEERFHTKTSGTSWLEAIRLVAMKDPALFRQLYAYAKEVFEECRAYYHVSTELSMTADIGNMEDQELAQLMNENPSRQLMHITYGKIMNRPEFREKLYGLWRTHREDYAKLLDAHLQHHLQLLCPGSRNT